MNPLIIKLGGVLLDSEEALERLFTALVNYRESHQRPLVIVHGGGCVVDELMKGLNLPVKKKNGLRVTPADQIDIITGALAGTANKTLLAWAKKHYISSVGLYLGDGDSVKVTQLDEALGHVGRVWLKTGYSTRNSNPKQHTMQGDRILWLCYNKPL